MSIFHPFFTRGSLMWILKYCFLIISSATLNEMVLSFGARWLVANNAVSPISHGLSLLRPSKTPTLPACLSSPVNTYRYSNTQSKYSNTLKLSYSNTQSKYESTSIPTQILKYLDTEVLNNLDNQTSNTQILEAKHPLCQPTSPHL